MKSYINKTILGIFPIALAVFLMFGCKKDQIAEITLKTNAPTNVTGNEVTVSAEIISDGGLTVTKRGVCFSVNENPTPLDGQVLTTSTSATFTITATNLIPDKNYYCRAFAESNNIVFYGQQVTFKTLSSAPYVQTTDLIESDNTSATFGGNIVSNGGYAVTARGLVWNTTGNPSLQNNSGVTSLSTSLSTFESKITDLTPQVTYYVCAYATNQMGTSYGKVKTFKNGWTQKANIPQEIVYNNQTIGFTIGNKGYALNISNIYESNFYEYDPVSNSWTQRASLNTENLSIQRAVKFTIGTKAYVGLGELNYGAYQSSAFWEYNSLTNTWTKLTDFPAQTRTGAFAFSIGDKAYVGGGYHQGYDTSQNLNDVWEFNPVGNSWVQKTNFPGDGSSELLGLTIGSMGYIADISDGRKAFWQYNPSTNTWLRKADFRGNSRKIAVAFAIGSKGFLGTGNLWDPQHYFQDTPIQDFWVYDPENNTWTRKADVAGGVRGGAFSFTIGNKGFVGGGYNETHNPKDDFWEYTPE